MLVLSESEVAQCLTTTLALQVSAHAFYQHSHQLANTPARLALPVPNDTTSGDSNTDRFTLFKPCLTPSTLGIKVVSVRPANATLAPPLPTVPATIMLVDRDTGLCQCVMGGTQLTAIRTAAGSALATQLFAAPTATTLTVFGAGLQSLYHIHGVLGVRPSIVTVNIVNRSMKRAEALIQSLQSQYTHVHFTATMLGDQPLASLSDQSPILASIQSLTLESQVICLCTNSATPVLLSSMVSDGTHINAVGSYSTNASETDTLLIKRCKVVVDDRATQWSSGDLFQAKSSGAIDESHIAGEIGEFVSDRYSHWPPTVLMPVAQSVLTAALRHHDSGSVGSATKHERVLRTSDSDVTLFKSVGTAVQDIVSAHAVYEAAVKAKIGKHVDIDK